MFSMFIILTMFAARCWLFVVNVLRCETPLSQTILDFRLPGTHTQTVLHRAVHSVLSCLSAQVLRCLSSMHSGSSSS